MAGVVYSGGARGTDDDFLGRYGDAIQVANGAVIPPGVYFVTAAWSILSDNTYNMPAGFCISDGANAKAAAANFNAIPLGARGEVPEWPWPKPWPMNLAAE